MQFALIDSKHKAFWIANFKTHVEALAAIGLPELETDHGLLRKADDRGPGLMMIVHEHSLFVPPAEQSYFAFGTHLYAGQAMMYAFDARGDTIDLELPALRPLPPIVWFESVGAVESAIRSGRIIRPSMAVNDAVFWRWPEPRT